MDEQNNRKDTIERDIINYKNGVEKIKSSFDNVKLKLVLDDSVSFDVTEAIRGLDNELRELNQEAENLIAEMDAFKLSFENVEFSMTPAEIRKTIKSFKERLKELKQHQIDRYNSRVNATNKMIEELRGKNQDVLNPEVVAMIQM